MGRYWIMDRDHRWERVEKGYKAMVNGKAEFFAKTAEEAIENAYKRWINESDQPHSKEPLSDEDIKDAIIYGYNLTANASLAQKDIIDYNFDKFVEAYLNKIKPNNKG